MRREKRERKERRGFCVKRRGSVAKWISVSMVLFLLSGLFTSVFAYDACGEVESIVLDKSGRKITYYDVYGGKMEGRPDTDDETQFYMDAVLQQDNFLKWANLAYDIFSADDKTYWDHAGNGWNKDFGSGHYVYFIDDMLRQRSTGGDDKMKSTGLSIAQSLSDVQSRAANDLASLIGRKLKGSDFLNRHKIDKLTTTAQPVVYSTVSNVDRYGKTPQYGYNSFTIAFYDFQLHVLDDGGELNTVTGDDSLQEAASKTTPGFSYSTGTTDDGMISLSQNDAYEDATVSLTLNESVSSSVSSSINHSENYDFEQTLGVSATFGAKIPLIAEGGMTLTGGLKFGEAINTAYGESNSLDTSQSKSTSVTMNLPAHTIVGANQTKATTKMTTSYDCPIGITYKVAIFSMCGTVYDDNAEVQSFSTAGYDQRSFITIFGNDGDVSDAVENLYQRGSKNKGNSSYEETYGYTKGTKHNGDIWTTKLNWNNILGKDIPKYSSDTYKNKLKKSDDMVNALINRYPMSVTGASSSIVETGINSEMATPVPLYPIQYISIKYQLNRDFDLKVGESLPIYSYRVNAYDQDMVPYHGFVPRWGEWKIVDANGKPTTSNVAQMTLDPVTHQQCVLATGEGTTYVKYFISDDANYVDYSGRVSNNDTINSVAYKIIVTAEEEAAFDGRIDLTGDVTAMVGEEAINLNAEDTLSVAVYDKTDKQVDLTVQWEAQELEKSGISVTKDGVLTVSKPGTFHVRAFYQDVYSDWAVVNAVEGKGQSLVISSESAIAINSETLEKIRKFDGNTMLSRGEFVRLLHSLCGSPKAQAYFDFHDVDTASVYRECLSWAKEKGFICGGADGAFEPESGLTRQQMAVIIFQMAKEAGLQPDLSPERIKEILLRYADGDQIEIWAQEAMAYAVENGYIQPDENNNLNGQDFVKKPEGAEAMSAAVEAMDMIPEEIPVENDVDPEEIIDIPEGDADTDGTGTSDGAISADDETDGVDKTDEANASINENSDDANAMENSDETDESGNEIATGEGAKTDSFGDVVGKADSDGVDLND